MRIVVTGNSGSGKTTTRLMLRSMAPQYTVIMINAEMEAFIQLPFDSRMQPIETLDVIGWLCDYVKTHDNVIVSMMYFFGTVDQTLLHDVVLYLACTYDTRRDRVIARSNIPTEEWTVVDEVLSAQPTVYNLPSNVRVIDNNGSRDNLTNTLIALVDEWNLRPTSMPLVDV